MGKGNQILIQYYFHTGDGQLPQSLISPLSKGLEFEITSQHHYRRHLCIFFYHCIPAVWLYKTETLTFTFFFFLLNFSLEGQKCCHIAYSNQFKQYQIFPEE